MDRTRTVIAQTREKVESLHVAAAAEPSVVASRTAVCQHRSVKIAALRAWFTRIWRGQSPKKTLFFSPFAETVPRNRHHSTIANELGCIRMMPAPSGWTSSATSVYMRTASVRWQRAFASETPGTTTFTSAVSVTLLSSE